MHCSKAALHFSVSLKDIKLYRSKYRFFFFNRVKIAHISICVSNYVTGSAVLVRPAHSFSTNTKHKALAVITEIRLEYEAK